MRLLALLVLGVWPAVSNALFGSIPDMFAAYGLRLEGIPDEPLSWGSMVACKAELVRLQQKSVLHTAQYNTQQIQDTHSAAIWTITVLWLVSLLGLLYEKRKRAAHEALASNREQELLERCRGVQEQAFDLGHRATTVAVQLSQTQLELTRARTERDDARRQNQDLFLRRQQVLPTTLVALRVADSIE